MENEIMLEQIQRRDMRWRILRILYFAVPLGTTSRVIWLALTDMEYQILQAAVYRELDYLEGLGLVEILNRGKSQWSAKLSSAGVDVVEYTTSCPAGIARPEEV